MPLEDGAHMDVTVTADVSQETLDALRRVGDAAAALMRNMEDTAEAVEHLVEDRQEQRLGFRR